MWLSKCFKIPKLSLRDFILKSTILFLTLPLVGIAQEKVGFKSFPDLTEGASNGMGIFKNKILYSVFGNAPSDSNKSYNLMVAFSPTLDSLSSNVFHVANNAANDGFNLIPFTNTSGKLFYWGKGANYASFPITGFTYVFGNANQTDYSLINHKAYRSKYYHVFNYAHTFLNDSVFISVHNFKWNHPSSLPYGTSIWWFNSNTMDTIRQKIYFEASGNIDLTPFTVYPLPNKDILVSGYTDTVNLYNGDAFLMRLDSAGNVKYARSIGTSASELMYLAKVDTSFYFIGSSSPSYSNNPNSNIYLSKVDITNGNLLKTYKITHDSIGITSMGNVSVHGGKIFVPCNTYSRAVPPYKLKSFYFIIDTNGIISKQYIHSQTSNGYWNSYTKPIVTDSLKNVYGSIMSYNSNSDPRYTKLFKLDSNLVGCYPSDVPFSFTTTIANGALHSLPMSIVTANDSVFEVTSPGAIVQGHGFNTMVDECSSYVGIEEHTGVIKNTYFKIYPNPSSGIFYYQVLSDELNDATLEVYDLTGKRIISGALSNNNTNGYIDLSNVTNGIYFVKVANNQKILFNTKLNVVK